MFSDKSRLLKMIALGGIVFGLCYYASWQGPRVDPPPATILSRAQGENTPIATQYTEIMAINPEASSVSLKTEGHTFTAQFAELPALKMGQNLSLTGTVVAPNLVRVDSWHLHPARPLKYYFSLPAIALVIFLLFKKYRFDWRRFEFFEKTAQPVECKK